MYIQISIFSQFLKYYRHMSQSHYFQDYLGISIILLLSAIGCYFIHKIFTKKIWFQLISKGTVKKISVVITFKITGKTLLKTLNVIYIII